MKQPAKFNNLSATTPNAICDKFTSMSIDDCTLQQNRIDIWQFPLHKLWRDAAIILNDTEQKRAARFYFDKHRNRFIAAHAFLRSILSRYLQNKNPNTLKFIENKYGKPKLKINHEKLEFNLSHSENLGILAIGQNYALGVDIEFFSAREYLSLAAHAFSKNELFALKNINQRMQAQMFFNIWAQKEAFIKACGMGLSYPTQEFDVPPFSSLNTDIFDSKHKKNWKISSFKPTIDSCGAICYDPKVTEIRYIILDAYHDIA